MNTSIQQRVHTLRMATGLLIVALSCGAMLAAPPFSLVAVSDLDHIFEDGYNLPAGTDTIRVFGIRGEVISAQFVLEASDDLSAVAVEPGPLTHQTSGNPLAPETIAWNFVGSIPLAKNAGNQPEHALVRRAPARFPDYLMAERSLAVAKGTFRAIWLTIAIPEDAEPGIYLGRVTVRSAQGKQSLPLELTVYPLTLPAKRNLKVTEWYTTRHFARHHGIEEPYSDAWFAMLRNYAENMAAHRQNVFQVPATSIRIQRLPGGQLEFDFTRFDQIAEVFWNTGRMDYLETGELARFHPGGFASREIRFKDFTVTDAASGESVTLPGDDVVPHLLPAWEDHLRRKGWLRKTLFHIKDEPAHHNALEWMKVSRAVHQYAPDLRRLDALCTSFVLSDLEIAVPKLDALDAGYDIFKQWQDQGNELWFYTVGIFQGSSYPNKTIDVPVIGSRILHWLNWKYGAVGFLHWGWNQWVEDPFRETGQHLGDAWHVYPVRDGVLNSIRWEQMRNGIQDYEILRMLEQRVAALKNQLGSRFSWIEPGQRSREITSRVATSLARHSTVPAVLYDARRDVINELLEFDSTPRLYLQTSPAEHGPLMNRSVVEILGWAEPGSEVTVNRQDLPVARDGLLMGRFLISASGRMEITVRKAGRERKVQRIFPVSE